MAKKVECCTLFFQCEFLLEGFSHKVFNETTWIQLTNVMYYFLQEPFFSIGFSDGVFNEACVYRGNRPRESVVKHMDSIMKERKRRNPSPSPFVYELLPNS
jgi:hypothetical protein